ncbi:MAG: hypothetical protein AB2A00_42890, partial [Myxococcota bacterium]
MTRTYDAAELVTLPRLDVSTALSLATQVVAAAEEEARSGPLPPSLTKPLGRLKAAHADLEKAAVRQTPLPREDSERAREADRRLDSGWAGVHMIAQGHLRFP